MNNILKALLPIGLLITIELLSFFTYLAWAKTFSGSTKNILVAIYGLLTLGLIIFLLNFQQLRNYNSNRELKAVVSVIVFSIVIGKLFVASITLLDFLRRFVFYIIAIVGGKETASTTIIKGMTRSTFFTKLALGLGGSAMGLLYYGMSNRYNYKVRNIKVPIKNLPVALQALKIVQISDIHSGSFTDVAKVQAGINKINSLKPDLIFFTGDLVNNLAEEMTDYIAVFKQLSATLGVYSILGNHDYADYYYGYETSPEKVKNLAALKEVHRAMGWNLLLNENKIFTIGNAQLALIGVENISGHNKRFKSYGNMAQAYQGTNAIPTKILLSHDPSHWDAEVKLKYKDVQLTLSGHTHGMQFGIDMPGFKWSPVQYVYRQWAGLYKEGESYLHVNRGFGFLGYPGRVGILPEITSISLVQG